MPHRHIPGRLHNRSDRPQPKGTVTRAAAGLATVLGIPADDLAALTGIELPEDTPPQNLAAAEVAELIWEVRRLTADQLRHVRSQAESMQHG